MIREPRFKSGGVLQLFQRAGTSFYPFQLAGFQVYLFYYQQAQWLNQQQESELKLFAWTDFCFELGKKETVACGLLQRITASLRSTGTSMYFGFGT